MPIELTLHRMCGREPQPLDNHESARVEDEGIISFEPPDGGSAWVYGAGPGEPADRTTVEFSIDVLTEQLVQILYTYAAQSGMVIARLPAAVYVTDADRARHLPAGWPAPAVCATAERLLELLSED